MQLKVCLKTIFMLGTGMPKIPVSKTQVIASPIEKVFEVLSDVHSCLDWSPWLIVDPDCTVGCSERLLFMGGCDLRSGPNGIGRGRGERVDHL